jgi:hypothetical protein
MYPVDALNYFTRQASGNLEAALEPPVLPRNEPRLLSETYLLSRSLVFKSRILPRATDHFNLSSRQEKRAQLSTGVRRAADDRNSSPVEPVSSPYEST